MKAGNNSVVVLLSFILSCILCTHPLQAVTRIGVVLSVGGLGDCSFNDAAYDGVRSLRNRPNCIIEVIEPGEVGSIESALEYFSRRELDLIFAVGIFANEPMMKISARYPDRLYVLLDSVVTAPNVMSLLFNEEEGSFYAGAMASLLTRTKKIGFLGGMTSPVVESFERGFRNGIGFVNPEAEIITHFAGDSPEAFNKPELGKQLGLKMAADGCDLIFHAAGRTGLGLIDAARQSKFLVIGVDTDQTTLAPGKIAASMVKRLDIAMDLAVKNLLDGRFKGGVVTLGMVDGAIELVLSRFNKSLFTPLVKERLQEVETFLLHKTHNAQ